MNDEVKILQLSYGNYVSVDYYFKLQSNWNSLREWLEKENEYSDYRDVFYREHMGYVLDKMNELEGNDKE